MRNSLKFAASILMCLLIGVIGSVPTLSSIPTWYSHLVKPTFNPPNYLFGPVWSVLYILMGISFYIIWKKGFKSKKTKQAMTLFFTQLILNAIWSPVFFGYKNILLALIVIVFLWLFILRTILAFAKIDKLAGYLLYPYFAWVSFASILNFSIWILNR